MKRRIILLLTIINTIAVAAAPDFTITSRSITTADGLAGNTINEIVQDEDGYIWMATNNGLCRYDGYSTVSYSSLAPSNGRRIEARVGRIYLDRPRRQLWMSTATFQNACYDLTNSAFVDWSGTGTYDQKQNKMMLTSQGMMLYGMKTGAKLCGITDGRHWARNYTKQQKDLPSDEVLSVAEDSTHNIWIATDKGVSVIPTASPNGQAKIVFGGQPAFSVMTMAVTHQAIYILTRDGNMQGYDGHCKKTFETRWPASHKQPERVNTSFVWNNRWMLFTTDGTYSIDLKTGKFEKPIQWQIADGLNQGQAPGYHFVGTRSGQLWIFPDHDKARYLDLIPKASFSTNKGWLFHIAATPDGQLFIATYGAGLYLYNPADGGLQHFTADNAQPLIGSNYLLCAITDRHGSVWVGSETAGAYCLTMHHRRMADFSTPATDNRGDWANSISMVTELGGHVIVGTREGAVYDMTNGQFKQKAQFPSSVTCLLTDHQGHIWTGTVGHGLYRDGKRATTASSINALVEDCQHRLWVATWNDGILMIDSTEHRYMADNLNGSRINALRLAEDGTLWAASNNGIYHWNGKGFDVYNQDNSKLPNNEIHTLCIDGRTLWAGTAGSGVIKCSIGNDGNITDSETIGTPEGLPNNNATSIVRDRQGYIWVGTEDGIARINPKNNIVNTYQFSTTLRGNVSTNDCATITHDGHLLFGTAYGLLTINPKMLHDAFAPTTKKTAITDLRINGTSIFEGGAEGKLHYNMTLRHDQNTLTLFFSNFVFDKRQHPVYQYYLEGHESSWQQATTRHFADYSELPPDKYIFHLRTLDANNEWGPETKLIINIKQPWWNTWWAWLIYLLTTILMVYNIYSNWHEKFLLHQQMKMERQLSEFRQTVFTNITHEFRTPIAIIKGAVDKLGENSANRAALQTAQRGAKRLLRLVNLFMEYRRISTGKVKLQVEDGDIVSFVRDLVDDFWALAQQKDIQITFIPTAKQLNMAFDHQMVETIVYNLLSNAVKYTPERGSIRVRLKVEGSALLVKVEDNGPGISEKRQAELFKPFMNGLASQGGMGIGLYTAQQMAIIHHGSLSYKPLQPGSCFILEIPTNDTAFSAEEHREDSAISNHNTLLYDDHASNNNFIRELQGEALNEQHVAIVEDNPDMLEQISSEVGIYFKTDRYSTGQALLDALTPSSQETAHTIPNLVICDVTLPDTSGYKVVNRLKSLYPQLPIIMLTAHEGEEYQLKAYRAGADAYMVKPCNYRLLIARTIQLIKGNLTATVIATSADQNPKNYENTQIAQTSTPIIESRADKIFLDKLEMLIAQHMAEEGFTVDVLAQMMTMGRTKFYAKVKELTGMSPNKYLQEARMQKAADLLASGEMNVSEVSYRVGIMDPSYFNKCFKAKFGVVPSKYKVPF